MKDIMKAPFMIEIASATMRETAAISAGCSTRARSANIMISITLSAL